MMELTDTPAWPTTLRSRLADGRLLGTDNSVWLYRAVPMAPVADAKTPPDALAAATSLMAAYEELSALTPITMTRRAVAKSNYRQTHLLLVNVPRFYEPDRDHANAEYLRRSFGKVATDRRVLLFGVRLKDKVGGAGGFKAAVDSVVETIVAGQTPLSDYDADFAMVDAALSRAGLNHLSNDEMRLANSWWNHGRYPDTPILVHADHVHIFSSVDAVQAATSAGVTTCETWDATTVPGQHAVTFASVADLDLPFVNPAGHQATWVTQLLGAGALVVSVRGNVEPGEVTRAELRRQRKRYIDDINERAQNGKMERAEQTEMLGLLESVEGAYANGASAVPTLAGASIVVGFDGQVGDISQLVPSWSPVKLNTMAYRQPGAMAETFLCSSLRANPNLHDLPAQTIACSGAPSLSFVGDKDGALVGFTERDRQPTYLSPTAASTADGLPIALCAGATGSGKLLRLTTKIPTPTGWTTMGELKIGDQVLGRDGKPCRVQFVSETNERPDLYRVTFSDGQSIDADYDHQWVVSSFADRNAPRKPKHLAAIENWDAKQHLIDALDALAQRSDDREVTLDELFSVVRAEIADAPWRTSGGLDAALNAVDAPFRFTERTVPRGYFASSVTKTDPVLLFPVAPTLQALIRRWTNPVGSNAVRWAASSRNRADAARAALDAQTDPTHTATMPEIVRMLMAAGAAFPRSAAAESGILRDYVRGLGIEATPGRREVTIPLDGSNYTTRRQVKLYALDTAVKSLAMRVRQQYSDRPTTEAGEVVVTTGEMLAAGIRLPGGHANFAVRVTEALDLPDAQLPVPPYTMGAWLGDGSSNGGGFTGIDTEIIDRIEADGFEVTHGAKAKEHYIKGLVGGLREAGVLKSKHIPAVYLRASRAQRLELLRGLMDTDGTISCDGACEFSVVSERLATGTLELVRSLGIKAAMTSGPATITEDDPDNRGHKRRRVVGTRYRIKFTTTTQVFALPRKAVRVPTTVRETQGWNYVTSVEPISTEPGRCIQVDSPDATYLAEGFVPTHNTMLLLNTAEQFSRMGRPTIIIDPKTGSSHDAVVLAAGGQVASLDELASSDGIFDPMRFSAKIEVGVELAASMLMSINPWGSAKDDMEVPLQRALAFGAGKGASCIGEALRFADAELELPAGMLSRVFDMAESSPMFRACVGVEPGNTGLRAAEGITLIKVGDAFLDLPEPGVPPASISQRISMALVRMMVFGSAMALTGRGGAVMLDEAWVFLGAGRSEVERLGRLARSQQVLPMLFTQRVTDALNAGLAGYISRGLILPIEDRAEAQAACELFGLEPTPERLGRITAKATMGSSHSAAIAPNWNSMRALRDPATGRVLRGAVAIYADLSGRAIPVEVTLPEEFLMLASTNPEDIKRRLAARSVAEATPPATLPTTLPGAAQQPSGPRTEEEEDVLDSIF